MTGLTGRRLVIANWRDPWHPEAGGAESYAWELATRLLAGGAKVRFLTARGPGQTPHEVRDGVEIVRVGGRFTVYPLVLLRLLRWRRWADGVLDAQNGIPFFSPCVLPRRTVVVCLVHHVHDKQFGLYFPPWMAWAGRMLEGPVARRAYRRHACAAVSRSTERAMRDRLGWTGEITLVPPGVTVEEAVRPAGHETGPELVCVSRLVPHKRIERIVELADRLRERHPGLRVHIVGDGPEAGPLGKLVAERGLGDVVTLHGFIPEAAKAALIAGSDLHLSATQGEGWGLSVTEAAALGVPTAAYDVDGLRDAVRDGVTGWLARDGEDLAEAVERALAELADPARRAEISAACREWAAQFDWATTADRIAALLAPS